MKPLRKIVAITGGAALAAGVVYVNVVAWNEAFGSGPPYYGRTVNMDKWSDPRPALVGLDLVALAASWWLIRFVSRGASRE